MQVTINSARSAVIKTLDAAFPNILIAGEEIGQNLDPPRFFVQLLKPAHTQELGRRYRRDHPFVIQYFSREQTNKDMYSMAEQLLSVLKFIAVGGRVWPGQGMSFQIMDGILHFFVSYNFLVWEEQSDESKMQMLEQEVNIHEKG